MTLSANAGRPLFVPPGIQVVRTGPTTVEEFERLLDDDEPVERSGVRPIPRTRPRNPGLLQFV
ncbi:MAG TPA: hypothetical protein VHM25_10315, partial [Polyangiaceae bacterium]|nr:hypothetical protein [Polyangiaceae bacterium]